MKRAQHLLGSFRIYRFCDTMDLSIRRESQTVEIMLERALPDKKDALFRLLQYSLFEESLTDLNDMNDDALFDYPWFDAYFVEPEREAYFIRERGTSKLLGFAMVRRHEDGRHSIAEFLVNPNYRRCGVGTQAAKKCFALHDGRWEVKPVYGSERARLFWQKVIEQSAEKATFENGTFIFEMK